MRRRDGWLLVGFLAVVIVVPAVFLLVFPPPRTSVAARAPTGVLVAEGRWGQLWRVDPRPGAECYVYDGYRAGSVTCNFGGW